MNHIEKVCKAKIGNILHTNDFLPEMAYNVEMYTGPKLVTFCTLMIYCQKWRNMLKMYVRQHFVH